MVYITHFWKTIEQMVYVHPSWNMLGITAWLAHPLYNYTTVDPKQWVDSRSVLGNKVKDMK
jgi:hypothetical protein